MVWLPSHRGVRRWFGGPGRGIRGEGRSLLWWVLACPDRMEHIKKAHFRLQERSPGDSIEFTVLSPLMVCESS